MEREEFLQWVLFYVNNKKYLSKKNYTYKNFNYVKKLLWYVLQ